MAEIKGLLNIARKAGYIIIGQDNLKNYDKKLFLIMCDESAGSSLEREMNFLANKKQIPIIKIEGLEQLLSIQNCKAVGIKNKSFSDNILKSLKGE